MPSLKTISFNADRYRLTGTLHLPDRPQPPVVIGCHGLLANRHSPKQISLAKACERKGLAYFRFDHRGCGDSQGEFSNVTTLRARRQDLYHAVETMQHLSDVGPVMGLFGSSFGGTVVMAYAAANTTARLIIYAAPINSADIDTTHIRDSDGQSPSKTLLTDALTFDIAPDLGKIKNILVAHSSNDEIVPIEHAQKTYRSVHHPKKLVLFEGGDHRMSNTAHQKRFENNFIAWLMKNK